jgi:hypothetical protein
LNDAERRRQISEAAYYRAERRGFSGDRALDDWVEAERELSAMAEPDADDLAKDIPQPDQRNGAPVPAPLAKENAIQVEEAMESAEQLKAGTGK